VPGLIRGVARTAAVAGTATAGSNRVSRRQGERWAAQQPQEAQPYAAPPQAAAPPPAAPREDTSDRIAALRQLGELRDQGVLTDAEFEAEKARILGSS
jgi:hypothetical protein